MPKPGKKHQGKAPAPASEAGGRTSLSGAEYHQYLPALRFGLLDAQRALREAGVPVVIVVAGADAVKSDTVNALNSWMDPRGVMTHTFGPEFNPDPLRPHFAPFHEALPPRGSIALFCGSWYSPVGSGRIRRDISRARAKAELERIAFFEKMLTDAGVLIIKIWLHLDEESQRKRLKKLSSDPRTAWKVSADDWKRLDVYTRLATVRDDIFAATHTAHAPWVLIDATDDRYSHYMAGQAVLGGMTGRLTESAPTAEAVVVAEPRGEAPDRLSRADLGSKLSEEEYEDRMAAAQARLSRLSRLSYQARKAHVLVFEGWDAAGKGGTIRRLVEAIDARNVRVIPIAAPTPDELQRHYLWRFWRNVPRDGQTAIFDRSWYGRVLVERVEGFATEAEWRRAYDEINDFEENLVSHGTTVTKFWLHLSPEEQLRRFDDRSETPYKRHKVTSEDWRNREKWPAYHEAVNDVLDLTDRPKVAPWHVVPSEDKLFARVQVIETVVARMERALRG
ncbi:MAG: polyphosphate:AMP phosphotransferase [Chloroflexi bacterium]|nr:polyphosphate:AMP phosphotransferase [Chloroflexota bacterium]